MGCGKSAGILAPLDRPTAVIGTVTRSLMARRGKAASRQSRQRRRAAQRPAVRPQTGAPATQQPATESAAATSATAVASPAPRSSLPASQRGSRVNPKLALAGPSRLTERAIAEYHYVKRDLRNIGILMAIMAAILVVAVLAFTALGIGKTA